MKTLYFECDMGAAGDMLMAALLELHPDPNGFLRRLNDIGMEDVIVESAPSMKCGIGGTHISVKIAGAEEACDVNHHHSNEGGEHGRRHEHEGEHSHVHGVHEHLYEHKRHHEHNSFSSIEGIIGALDISPGVKRDALNVYKLIAQAESHVHGKPVSEIHFHEVGTMDAVADIVGVCMLIEELAPDTILSSPINTGSGHVHCAHGILPVPAPAAAYILQGVPIYSDNTKGELCTPTGAALLKYFANGFCAMPVMRTARLGYGMGKKDFEKANCVRAFWGERDGAHEEVVELVCNLDDMTPEAVAFAFEALLENGALDVYTTPIGMKKNRAGIMLSCLCKQETKDDMTRLIFKNTTTLGIREYSIGRHTLSREQRELSTRYGSVRIKAAQGFGVNKAKPEYEDIAKIARKEGIPFQDVINEVYVTPHKSHQST